jgi:hypothetical protein
MKRESNPVQPGMQQLPLWSYRFTSGARVAVKTRHQLEVDLVRRAMNDESFRARFRSDPKGTIEEELGARLPASLSITVVEEEEDCFTLVVPCNPYAGLGEAQSQQFLGMSLEELALWVCNNTSGAADPSMAKLLVKAWTDEEFVRHLIAEPRQALEEVLSSAFDTGVCVQVFLESPDRLFILLPLRENLRDERWESLSEADLTPFETTAIGTLTTGNCGPKSGATGCPCSTNTIFTCG